MDAPAAFRMASTFTSATPLRIAWATAAPDWRKLTFSGTVTVVSPLEGTGGTSAIAMRPTVEPAMSTVPRIPPSGRGKAFRFAIFSGSASRAPVSISEVICGAPTSIFGIFGAANVPSWLNGSVTAPTPSSPLAL